MINKYNGGKVDYVGIIVIALCDNGCNRLSVYSSDEASFYQELDEIDFYDRQIERGDSVYVTDNIDTKYYHLIDMHVSDKCEFNDSSHYISVCLKQPLTAKAYADIINYFDKLYKFDFKADLSNTLSLIVSFLKNKKLAATEYDIIMMQNFNNGEGITDYEQDYNVTPDEIRNLFD